MQVPPVSPNNYNLPQPHQQQTASALPTTTSGGESYAEHTNNGNPSNPSSVAENAQPPFPSPPHCQLQLQQLRRRRRRELILSISLRWGEKRRDPAMTALTRMVWLETIVPGGRGGRGKKEARRKVVEPREKAKVESPRTTIATKL